MTLDTLFLICNAGVVPFWLLLAIAPTWKWTQRLVHSALLPAVFGLIYVVLLATAGQVEGGSFGSLDGVTTLFTSKQFVLVGWVHYLVFDLFVGAWEARDAARLGISRWVLLPCLFFTFMLGPSGLLLYLVLRAALRKRALLDEAAPEVTEPTPAGA